MQSNGKLLSAEPLNMVAVLTATIGDDLARLSRSY
jgi:hypothetical protein